MRRTVIFMMTEDRKNGKNVLSISLLSHMGYVFRSVVNFTNVLHAAFAYVSFARSFFVQVCTLLAHDCWCKSCVQNIDEIEPRKKIMTSFSNFPLRISQLLGQNMSLLMSFSKSLRKKTPNQKMHSLANGSFADHPQSILLFSN